MLRVELACQEFDRLAGHTGCTSWPLNISQEQVEQLMGVAGVFTPNTRTRDQVDGAAIWSVISPVLLLTVLQNWEKRRPWARSLLDILRKEDSQLKKHWDLRMIYVQEPLKEEVPAVAQEEVPLRARPHLDDEIEALVEGLGEGSPLW